MAAMSDRADRLQTRQPHLELTWTLKYRPTEEVDEAAKALLSETPQGRAALARLRAGVAKGWGYNPEGELVFYGKKCCSDEIMKLMKSVETLEVPSEHKCDRCHGILKVSMESVV